MNKVLFFLSIYILALKKFRALTFRSLQKLDRLKQWAGERMGGEVKTGASDEFQNLEMEMKLRHEGKNDMSLEL